MNKQTVPHWGCVCDCGTVVVLPEFAFKYGNTKSCGCLGKDLLRQRSKTHGESKTRLYCIWKNMKGRCYTKSSTRFSSYGGRGVTVCEIWKNDFNAFKLWALSSGYSDNLSIDRVDNDGNYESSNCQWITVEENSKLMNKHHLKTKTGGHSEQARALSKHSNRENSGIPISLSKGLDFITFTSIGEAADYFSEILQRKRENVYSHLKQLRKGKSLTIGGWEIANN